MALQKVANRKARLALYGAQYVLAPVSLCECVYCGGQPSGEDHVPPVSKASWSMPEGGGVLYPACGLCNETLSAYAVLCLKERAKYLLSKLRETWLATAKGKSARHPLERVENTGTAIKARLTVEAFADVCQCRKCRRARTEKDENQTGEKDDAYRID